MGAYYPFFIQKTVLSHTTVDPVNKYL